MTAVNMTSIRRRIRQARLAAGFETVSAGARVAGVPVPTAITHENVATASGRAPKLEALVRYADAYRVSLYWLVTGKAGQ